jgi:nucleotide-binding universal stress UspA family protein
MRIMVASDGSPDASNAIEWLMHFPAPADASVEVVTVIPRQIFDEVNVRTPWSELRAETERGLEAARGRLARRWPTATARLLYGDPREAIPEAVQEAGVDLIVLGARGLGAMASFLLGSISLGVARHAPCAVLVCKGPARPLRSVTIAVDGSPDSSAAFAFFSALPLPKELAAHLVGVVQPLGRYPSSAPDIVTPALISALKQYEEDLRKELEAPLRDAASVLQPRLARATVATPIGLPAEAILREAKSSGSDLIVVGARGLGPLKRVLLGSVSESVLGHADCPVLIGRAPRENTR